MWFFSQSSDFYDNSGAGVGILFWLHNSSKQKILTQKNTEFNLK